jgi:hypothetical protein
MKTSTAKLDSFVREFSLAVALVMLPPGIAGARDTSRAPQQKVATTKAAAISDAALVKSLPGFKNAYANVNGIRLRS